MYIFWIGILFDFAFAGLYYAMAKAVASRRVSGEAQWALYGFSIWWIAIGFNSGLSALGKLGQEFIGWSPAAYEAFVAVTFLSIMYGLAGLQYYLAYLVSGKWGAWKFISLYYLALYGFTMYLIALSGFTSVSIDHATGAFDTEVAVDLSGTWEVTLFSLALILPVLLGAITYASFFFKVEDRTQKFRIAMVSMGFVVWFGVGLAGSLGAGSDGSGLTWTIFSRVIALLAIWMNYQAFSPSKWLQKRFRIQPI